MPGRGRPKLPPFSAAQVKQITSLAGIGCTNEHIATILGVSEKTFERRVNADPVIYDALARGRALAASNVMQTAFQMAISGRHPTMTQFWVRCRLRWTEPKVEANDDDDLTIQLNYKK